MKSFTLRPDTFTLNFNFNFTGTSIGKQGVLFVDDLSLPVPLQSGVQPPVELLRQVLDHGGWCVLYI